MRIDGIQIGPRKKPYVVAEISANHNGSVAESKRLVDVAKTIGASAVKIQCYTAESLCAKQAFMIDKGIWSGTELFDLYKRAETPPEMAKEIIQYAQSQNFTCFSSVFDFENVDFLFKLKVPAFKIASFELVNLPLIERVANCGIPTIISTGMGSTAEIVAAVNTFRGEDMEQRDDLALLHCVSEYPTSASQANLPALGPLSSLLGGRHVVGISDHSLGIAVAVVSVGMGACIIEKHLTLDRGNHSPDADFSLEPDQFAAMIVAVNEAHQACLPSVPSKAPPNIDFRSSLYVVQKVSAGNAFSCENVRPLRPALGLSPRLYPVVLGGVALRDLEAGTPLKFSDVSTLS